MAFAFTARLRFTVIYAGLFLLLGTAVIATTYLLERRSNTVDVAVAAPIGPSQPGVSQAFVTPGSSGSAQPRVRVLPGPTAQVRHAAVQQHDADVSRLLEISWLVLAVTTMGAAVLGWFAAGRLLSPLRAITATARTISAGSLDQRLAVVGPEDEFKQLGDTLDDLLARLQASFEAQRRFVANASHELRTPLTLERALLQVALADPNVSAESLRSTCEELLVSQAEHEQLLESLLTLATSERGLEHRQPLDLAALASRAVDAVRPAAARRGLELSAELAPAQIIGDVALVQRLVANLLDNAVEHNLAGGWVKISTAGRDGLAVVSVANTGPAIGPDDAARLFEPFQRLGPRRADAGGHHGLGLSIVRAIAVAHGASVKAIAQREGGLAVFVEFALDPSAAGAPTTDAAL